MDVKIDNTPKWTEKDYEVIREYEKQKKEGTLKEYILIKKGDTPEQVMERLHKIMKSKETQA